MSLPDDIAKLEWIMFLDKKNFPQSLPHLIQLKAAKSELDWFMMENIRKEIEQAFGIHDSTLVSGFVKDIVTKSQRLNGTWYLAFQHTKVVGEVGLVPFPYREKIIGRIQDVDIVPSKQGKGLGKQLLLGLCNKAREMNLDGLCLFADANGWVKDWYLRFGFEKVGVTDRLKLC